MSDWTVPGEHPDLANYHTHNMFAMPRRVAGELAHDLVQHVVGLLGGAMVTRRLPITPGEQGLGLLVSNIWAASSRSWWGTFGSQGAGLIGTGPNEVRVGGGVGRLSM
ncbi:MAG: hypothetical protein OXU81_17550 [Gammaproteobacteria bacterium]|nr:hypothetical protein [Gammaproteobacteria bacterium]